jgi:uncharacterized membrane protein
MATLREARSLGSVGSILIILGVVQGIFGILLPLIGLVMLLLSVRYIGQLIKDRELFTNMMTFFAVSVLALLVGFFFVFTGIVALLSRGGSNLLNSGYPPYNDVYAALGAVIFGLFLVWVLSIIAVVFLRRVYHTIAENLGTGLFYTIGTLFLIGAILVIAVGIGLVIILVALALQAAAFLSLPDEVHPRPHVDPWGRPRPPNQT